MLSHLSLSAAVTPSGDPTLMPGLDPASVTPGTLGFLATLFIVVAVIFLIRDMVKRIRRVRYASEVEQTRAQRAPVDGEVPVTQGPQDDVRSDGLRPQRDVPRPGGSHGPDNR